MSKKLSVIALLILLLVAGCIRLNIEGNDNQTPSSPHKGVFSYVYDGTRYHQYSNRNGCSTLALINPKRDSLIISGMVLDRNKPKCTFPRLIFVIPMDRIDAEGVVVLHDEEIVVMTSDNQYMKGNEATITFDSIPDAGQNKLYISGTFDALIYGERVTLSDGLFKLWTQKAPDWLFRDFKRLRIESFGKSVPRYSYIDW